MMTCQSTTIVTFCALATLLLPLRAPAIDSLLINDQVESLDTVWQTVNEHHYDSTFGGLDWQEIRDRYHDLIARVESTDSFNVIANRMLLELELSHYAVFNMQAKVNSGSPLTSEASIGIDIRLLDNEAVVTFVEPDFPAAQAGLKTGYTIESIDGTPVDQIVADARSKQVAHFNDRRKLNNITDKVINRFFGESETPITFTYRDGASKLHEKTLFREKRKGEVTLSDELPPFYADCVAKRLDGNVGYIRFTAFLPSVEDWFAQAVDSMRDMRGLIIDIRGNPGGSHEVGEAIASQLIQDSTLFSVFRYRDRTESVVIQPQAETFGGPVVVLIDATNGSASERFTACIQSIGRAVIIGDRSPGSVGPSDLKKLPNGASFMYLIAQSLTPDGTVIEGTGVIPDFTVALSKEALLRGFDAQLERAVAYISGASR